MALAILVDVKEEVTCPICLELLTEPQSLDCGHSFCQSCLIENQTKSTVGQEGENCCPMCRVSYQPGSLRTNRHLANIAERLRKANVSLEEEQRVHHCARHGEKLLLFCKEDGKAICLLCERSQEHRGHQTFLIEEVAQEYQEKIQAALKKLMEKHQETEEWKADIQEERTSWKNQLQVDRQNVQAEFTRLRDILDSQEQMMLQKLEKEERDVLQILAESEDEVAQQSQLVSDLISDLEHRLEGSAMEMLQEVNGALKRSEVLTIKKPKMVCKEQRRMFHVYNLRQMVKMFKGLTDVQCHWVNVTLTSSNNPHIFISGDRKQVRYRSSTWTSNFSYSNDNCPYSGILGSPGITTGKHYWEVNVSNKRAWVLGVCLGTCPTCNVTSDMQQVKNYQPKYGYWVIGLQNRSEYKAFEESASSDPLIFTLSLTVSLCRVGVFIDYEAGTVSFFNVTNRRFLIYQFSTCRFSQEVFPYFNPMKCEVPMILCSPGS